MALTKQGPLTKSYILIPLVLILAGVVAAALAPLVKVPIDSAFGMGIPLYRVVHRCAAVLAIGLFIVFRKYLKSRVKSSINPKQYPPGKPFIGGFLVGLVGLLIVAVVMAALGGVRFINPGADTADFWRAFGAALGAAVAIAFLEEIFFRGIVFQGLQADLGTGLATIIAGSFFSLVHFMRPQKLPEISESDPLGGFKLLAHAFDRLGNFGEILPFAVGLFLIAVLLTVAYLRTSALFLPMGLHASLVFLAKLGEELIAYGKKSSPLLFGSGEPYPPFLRRVDSILTWIMLVVLTIVVAATGRMLQPKSGQAPSPKKGATPKKGAAK